MQKTPFDRLLEIIPVSLLEVGLTVMAVIVAAVLIEIIVYVLGEKVFKTKNTIPYMLLTPAIIGLSALVVIPILYELVLAFSNFSAQEPFFSNPQFGPDQLANNVANIFTRPILLQEYFFPIFLRTVLWTAIQVTFHTVGGLLLAMLLNRDIKGKGIYRTFLVIPWAVPQVVAVLAWRGEFNFEYGLFNNVLKAIGLTPIQWYSDWFWNIVAMNMVNIWLGIPFMMVILLGGLQSIPQDFYEAAEIDGANAWQRFTNVTLPMLQPVMTPAVALGVIWTFNNFNIPFFVNQNRLETSDILVTALFRAAFESPNRYGFAAAFAFVVFFILLLVSLVQMNINGTFKELGPRKKMSKKLAKQLAPSEAA